MAIPDESYSDAFRGAAVLISGGAGFIGSHLAHWLLELGAEVRVIDDLSTGNRANLPGPREEVEFFEASILDDLTLREAMAGCKYVFHQAAMVSVPLSVEQPMKCSRINITGTERVLEAAREAGIKRVMLASSAAVYGEKPSLPSSETDPIDCCSPYAASKAAGEALMSAFGRCYELSTVSLRYFNVFGPRQDPNSAYAAAIAAFIDALMSGNQPTVFGDGGQTRDFVYIDNVVHANLLAASTEKNLRGEVINIGGGAQISLLDVLKVLAETLGVDCEPVFEAERAGDVRHSSANIERARELLGFEPVVSFAEGMVRTVDALRA